MIGIGHWLIVGLAVASVGPSAPDRHPPTIGDDHLRVLFDARSGFPSAIEVEGERLLSADEKFSSQLVLNPYDANPPWQMTSAPTFVAERFVCKDAQTMVAVSTNADWRLEIEYSLLPDKLMLRRRIGFEWLRDKPGKVKKIWLASGKMACTTQGGYRRPMFFPPRFVSHSEFSDGVTERGHEDISPIAGENGKGWSVAIVNDGHQPFSDRAWSFVTQRPDGFSLSVTYETFGHVRRGVKQTVGDLWLVFRRGGVDDALSAIHGWYGVVGQKVLADRESRVKDLILYSTHPKGTTAEWLSDARGFRAMIGNLPLIDALGANAIWLRPVEDYTCYVPRDYYKLMGGVGTPEDFKHFVAAAHERKIEVWRDGVMHGGFSNNERTKQHPEWLCYREDGTYRDFWGYDFNWPTWVDYFAKYIGYMTKEYSLDGWRLDVPIGSLEPNWSEKIPYARASFSQYQGAWSQQRAIRKAMRAANPHALDLAESNLSQHGNTADAIYDQRIAHQNLPEVVKLGMSPKDFVRAMRRWLYEQEKVFLPDVVLMRYPESHDSARSADAYGRAPTDAMMAVCAWIKGFPLVYNEGEDGCFETWRRIFAVRRAVPELNDGDADYLGVRAPDGVLAWMRSGKKGKSIAAVNFNPTNVSGSVEWTGGKLPIALAPFGYTIARVEGRPIAELLPAAVRKPFTIVQSSTSNLQPLFDLRDSQNRLIGGGECVEVSESERGWKIRVKDLKGKSPKDVRLMVRFPNAQRWYARSSDGVWNSPHFVWHPSYDVVHSGSYHTMRHGALRWRNLYHPFGIDGANAEVGAISGEQALAVRGFRLKARVGIWDRVGADPTLAVSVSGDEIGDIGCEVMRVSASTATRNRGPDTGDARLKVVLGGYVFEEGNFKVFIDRTGVVRGAGVKVDDKDKVKVDCCHILSREPDGRLKIDFYDPRRATYLLGGKNGMELINKGVKQ